MSQAQTEQPIISLRNIYKSFDEYEVLKGVSFNIYPGETACVVGGSGSGKTVTIRHINGIYQPDSGEVRIFGEDITKFNQTQLDVLRKNIAYVFQGNALWQSMNTRANIEFAFRQHNQNAKDEELEQRTNNLIQAIGLSLEDKLKIPSQLSGGMQKRVAVARALYSNPEIILYDEPTTGLDPESSASIYNLIEQAKNYSLKQKDGKITSVIVTHDITLVKRLPYRVIFLKNGKVAFDGSPREFLNAECAQDFLAHSEKTTEAHLAYNEGRSR